MIFIRSALFNLVFYVNLVTQMIVFSPFYFLAPRRYSWIIVRNWIRSSDWLLRLIVGTTYEIEGLDGVSIRPRATSGGGDVVSGLPVRPGSEGDAAPALRTPDAAGVLQGACVEEDGTIWTTGQGGDVYRARPGEDF